MGPASKLLFYEGDLRTIETHSMNKRNQRGREKKHCRGIIKRGLSQSVRGDPVIVFKKDRTLPHQAITFGSLSNAFYEADRLAWEGKVPDKKYVQQSKDNLSGPVEHQSRSRR